ncbi:uncharacterized protein MYCFIDRAFT_176765 [Pseudocercospora fijiensis CIRAD86]|uniref:Uncharacterized protein n=1 Tax=Pseudocercospora fijiensis (strain CIRAD86) TaxID=383855 RepID=M2ZQY8_PSEFD|nr:uncharacterized protein MYCFIDRAFT_176765 [Pseudocercospora fijiensis CIRAD86]EME81489.1 hypothetical protein MYCFIDRAFT_176765 [Pseudocercospora fijiensis CIRAD86]
MLFLTRARSETWPSLPHDSSHFLCTHEYLWRRPVSRSELSPLAQKTSEHGPQCSLRSPASDPTLSSAGQRLHTTVRFAGWLAPLAAHVASPHLIQAAEWMAAAWAGRKIESRRVEQHSALCHWFTALVSVRSFFVGVALSASHLCLGLPSYPCHTDKALAPLAIEPKTNPWSEGMPLAPPMRAQQARGREARRCSRQAHCQKAKSLFTRSASETRPSKHQQQRWPSCTMAGSRADPVGEDTGASNTCIRNAFDAGANVDNSTTRRQIVLALFQARSRSRLNRSEVELAGRYRSGVCQVVESETKSNIHTPGCRESEMAPANHTAKNAFRMAAGHVEQFAHAFQDKYGRELARGNGCAPRQRIICDVVIVAVGRAGMLKKHPHRTRTSQCRSRRGHFSPPAIQYPRVSRGAGMDGHGDGDAHLSNTLVSQRAAGEELVSPCHENLRQLGMPLLLFLPTTDLTRSSRPAFSSIAAAPQIFAAQVLPQRRAISYFTAAGGLLLHHAGQSSQQAVGHGITSCTAPRSGALQCQGPSKALLPDGMQGALPACVTPTACVTPPASCHAIGYRNGATDSPLGTIHFNLWRAAMQDSNNATLLGMVYVVGDTKPRGVLTRSFIDLHFGLNTGEKHLPSFFSFMVPESLTLAYTRYFGHQYTGQGLHEAYGGPGYCTTDALNLSPAKLALTVLNISVEPLQQRQRHRMTAWLACCPTHGSCSTVRGLKRFLLGILDVIGTFLFADIAITISRYFQTVRPELPVSDSVHVIDVEHRRLSTDLRGPAEAVRLLPVHGLHERHIAAGTRCKPVRRPLWHESYAEAVPERGRLTAPTSRVCGNDQLCEPLQPGCSIDRTALSSLSRVPPQALSIEHASIPRSHFRIRPTKHKLRDLKWKAAPKKYDAELQFETSQVTELTLPYSRSIGCPRLVQRVISLKPLPLRVHAFPRAAKRTYACTPGIEVSCCWLSKSAAGGASRKADMRKFSIDAGTRAVTNARSRSDFETTMQDEISSPLDWSDMATKLLHCALPFRLQKDDMVDMHTKCEPMQADDIDFITSPGYTDICRMMKFAFLDPDPINQLLEIAGFLPSNTDTNPSIVDDGLVLEIATCRPGIDENTDIDMASYQDLMSTRVETPETRSNAGQTRLIHYAVSLRAWSTTVLRELELIFCLWLSMMIAHVAGFGATELTAITPALQIGCLIILSHQSSNQSLTTMGLHPSTSPPTPCNVPSSPSGHVAMVRRMAEALTLCRLPIVATCSNHNGRYQCHDGRPILVESLAITPVPASCKAANDFILLAHAVLPDKSLSIAEAWSTDHVARQSRLIPMYRKQEISQALRFLDSFNRHHHNLPEKFAIHSSLLQTLSFDKAGPRCSSTSPFSLLPQLLHHASNTTYILHAHCRAVETYASAVLRRDKFAQLDRPYRPFPGYGGGALIHDILEFSPDRDSIEDNFLRRTSKQNLSCYYSTKLRERAICPASPSDLETKPSPSYPPEPQHNPVLAPL